jgi:hypothetical protein
MTLKRASLVFLALAVYGIFLFLLYLWAKEPTSPHEFTPPWLQPNYEFTPQHSPANFESELEENRAKWDRQQITHYQMSLNPGYYYDQTPLIVEVRNGEVIAVTDSQGNEVSIEDEQSPYYYDRELFTVPGLFSYAHQTFLEEPPIIMVHYDPTFGYPDSIYIDPWVEPCCQDFEISVRDFQVLP